MSLYEDILAKKEKISLVGLGYVGMPIAVAFAKKVQVVGYDLNERKIALYKAGIDPTNEAYVMDDNQQMLSIFEVRERIIQDQPIVLNAEANWNNQYQVRKEYYLDEYMAKNLFYLSYILHSSYGADSRTPGNTIEFLRLEPLEVGQGEAVRMNQFNKFTLREYSTNNPQLLR